MDAPDAMRARKLEEVVEQRDEQGLARLGAEDPLEDDVGLGVGEDGVHGPRFYPRWAQDASIVPRAASVGAARSWPGWGRHGRGRPRAWRHRRRRPDLW